MNCAWDNLLSILPTWLRPEVDELGRLDLQELRLRVNERPELARKQGSLWLERRVVLDDLTFCVNAASHYSPWTAATMAKGFLTAPGGHRIGLCGEAVCHNGSMTGIKNLKSLCIRVARDFPGIASKLDGSRSLIILAPPGWGKTTLLRDLIRMQSGKGEHICVVDERGEVFPTGFLTGKCTDILTGCPKAQGIPALLRTMSPDCIAVDEITEQGDTDVILQAANCGVKLFATAHAGSVEEFSSRLVYQPLLAHNVFHTAVVLHLDKSYHTERMA